MSRARCAGCDAEQDYDGLRVIDPFPDEAATEALPESP